MRSVPILYDEDIAQLITPQQAADAIRDALLEGLEPGATLPRSVIETAAGQLLLMPAESSTTVGVKAVTVAPGNPARGLPRVHGAYLIYDGATLALTGIMDGATISNVRTPAVAMAATRPAFGRFHRPVTVTIFGAGPQALGHAQALAQGGFAEVGDLAYVVRQPERARAELGAEAVILAAADPALANRLRASDVIVCTTTSATPLFDSRLVRDGAIVMIIGGHEPTTREVDGALLGRSMVVVEDVATALREAGDLVMAIEEGHLHADAVVPMTAVIRGEIAPDPKRPYVYKGVGMSWEDLVVAEAVMRRLAETRG